MMQKIQGTASSWLFCLAIQGKKNQFISKQQVRDSVPAPDVMSPTENTKPLQKSIFLWGAKVGSDTGSDIAFRKEKNAVSEWFQIAGITNCVPACIH